VTAQDVLSWRCIDTLRSMWPERAISRARLHSVGRTEAR